MKKGLYGGTYNPVHLGHLRVAEEVREAVGLDKIIFMPTFVPPHKTEEDLIGPEARLELLGAAIADNPAFEASDLEIKRGGKSYTVDTVRELLAAEPDLELTLIMGTDQFNEIRTWCEYEELFKLVDMVVVPRSGWPPKKPGEALPVELARKFWYDSSKERFENSYGNTVTYLDTTIFEISSSDIRERLGEGRSARYLVHPEVERIIREKGYYRK